MLFGRKSWTENLSGGRQPGRGSGSAGAGADEGGAAGDDGGDIGKGRGQGRGRRGGRGRGSRGGRTRQSGRGKGRGKGKGKGSDEVNSDTDDASAQDKREAGSYGHSHSDYRREQAKKFYEVWNCLGRTAASDEHDQVEHNPSALYHCCVSYECCNGYDRRVTIKRMVSTGLSFVLPSLPLHAAYIKWMKFLGACNFVVPLLPANLIERIVATAFSDMATEVDIDVEGRGAANADDADVTVNPAVVFKQLKGLVFFRSVAVGP